MQHAVFKSAVKFIKSEQGVVALIFALMFPMIVIMLTMAFQFEQYNRYVNRVEQAQSVALQRARSQTQSVRRGLAEHWVKFNSSLVSGLSLADGDDNHSWEDAGYLWISSTLEDKNPILSWAVGSRMNSMMRIPLFEEDQDLTTCGNTYWKALYKCGKLSVNELRKISNEERIKIDQMALVNIGKNFFDSSGVGKKRGEIQPKVPPS